MTGGIRASLVVDQALEQSPLRNLLEVITQASGFLPTVITIDSGRSKPPAALLPGELDSPLIILALQQRVPAWLVDLGADGFRNCEVVVVVDRASPSLQELQTRINRVVAYLPSDVQASLGGIAQALVEVKEALARSPLDYVPLARRTTEAREPYEVLRVSKEVTIAPSGHGYIETEHVIRVTAGGFEGTSHYFGLNEYTPEAKSLPSLRELLHQPLEERHSGRSFSYRLLSPLESDLYMSVIEIEHESQPRTKVFRFLYSPEVKTGTHIRFAWSWSHPGIFNPDGEDASTLRCARDYGEVRIGITFLREPRSSIWPFADGGGPVLERKSAVGLELGVLMPRQEVLLHGTRFEWCLFSEQENTTLSARWRLR